MAEDPSSPPSRPAGERPGDGLATALLRRPFLLFAGVLLLAVGLYWPALDGPPIADDYAYLLNPWIVRPGLESVAAIFDPWSQATSSLKNYAPVRGLVHMTQWALHPQVSVAYHAWNLLLHALATVLLVRFLAKTGVPAAASLVFGLLFLVHPANVEAVAWMSQVWSPLALVFSLLALLSLRARPAAATLALVLGLLTKPLAVFAAPSAAVLEFCRGGRNGDDAPARWGWIVLWFVLVALFVGAHLVAYGDTGPATRPHEDPFVLARTMASHALRYLLMALGSFGVAPFQEPPLALSFGDPLWLASAAVLLALGLRLVTTLRARSPEAAGWVWVLAAFAPVSQVFPFLFPVADRYLYFMLPGLYLALGIGGRDAVGALASREARRNAGRALLVAGLALAAFFAVRTVSQARLWRSEDLQMAAAARAHPDGTAALVLQSRKAALEGDVTTVVDRIRRANARGWDYWSSLLQNPAYAEVRGDPRFRALIAELAAVRIAKVKALRRPTQMELNDLARAHELRGETAEAIGALDRALALGGPLDGELRAHRERLARSTPSK